MSAVRTATKTAISSQPVTFTELLAAEQRVEQVDASSTATTQPDDVERRSYRGRSAVDQRQQDAKKREAQRRG